MVNIRDIKTTFHKENEILAGIVCLGMFISNMIVPGINNAFGEIMFTVLSEFDSDLASVALVPSIHSSAFYFAGFICSVLAKWYTVSDSWYFLAE